MHRVVLHDDITEAAANSLNNPPRFSVLAITHQTDNLPDYRVDKEDGLQYVSCQGMCIVIFQQLAESNGPRR